MWVRRVIAGAVLTTGLISGGVSAVPAHAALGIELNGTYRVLSNGQWARTNEVYMNEATVVQVWTLSSTCTDPHTCNGTVTSDQGWSAPLLFRTAGWIVDRFFPDWQTCPDGTTSSGRQRYQFQATDANGQYDKYNHDQLTGYDRTIGVSGACGRNQQTVIVMPLSVIRI